jgi:hypothetical protein
VAKSNISLFIFHRGSETVFLLLYVNDIVISALRLEFTMKDLGLLYHFLGIIVERRPEACSYTGAPISRMSSATLAWQVASCALLLLIYNPSCRETVECLCRMPLSSGVRLEPCNTSHLPDLMCLIQFRRYGYSCTTPVSLIWQPSSASSTTCRALQSWAFFANHPQLSSPSTLMLTRLVV